MGDLLARVTLRTLAEAVRDRPHHPRQRDRLQRLCVGEGRASANRSGRC